jgi:RNA polymerase-binding transcription factor DksA
VEKKAKAKAAAEAKKAREREAAQLKKERDAAKKKAAAEAAAAKKAAEALAKQKAAEREAARLAKEAEKKAEADRKAAEKRAKALEKPPIVKGPSQDGITSTREFDLKFLFAQRDLLMAERAKLVGQATRLEDEANSLIADAEMGDVQFDDEGGEGDTMVVERERDLTLSASARQTVEEIDLALERLKIGEYGYSSQSGKPIPRERLKAIPWTTELVEERVGGLGRR